MPNINYPIDDMSGTANSLTTFLEDQWQQHTAQFMTNPESHTALLNAFAKVIPSAGGKAGDLSHALQKYHQHYSDCYQALQDLAANIDAAAQAMQNFDDQTKQTLK